VEAPPIIIYAIPFFVGALLLELFLVQRAKHKKQLLNYEVKDTFASLSMGVMNVIIGTTTYFLFVQQINLMVYEYRFFTLGFAWYVWLACFLAEDFCYYTFHWVHHNSRLFWAAHINHHSSERYNLSTALRQSWTTPITGVIFWWPLALLGFHPFMIAIFQSTSLLYQFWIHTELIDTMGPFEWIFNTPSHHRVHHGSNVEYLDRNHAGVLIIWDYLFRTFTKEMHRPTYGLVNDINTFNPFKIAFHEFAAIWHDVRSTRNPLKWIGYVFGPPGWCPYGSKLTTSQMRRLKHQSLIKTPSRRFTQVIQPGYQRRRTELF